MNTCVQTSTTPACPALWQLSLCDDTGREVCDRALAVAYLAQLAGRPVTEVAPLVSAETDNGWTVWLGPLWGEHAAQAAAALGSGGDEPAWYVRLPDTDGGVWVAVPLP